MPINKQESAGLKHLNSSKAFFEYSNDMNNIYKNIEGYNQRKILIVYYMISDMLCNKKLNPIVTELFIRGRKLNIFLVFITQCYLAVPKYFIMKIPNKQELQQITFNHSSDIDFKDYESLEKVHSKTILFVSN